MISPVLLAILRCPENRQPLVWADPEILAGLNARIAASHGPTLCNRGGAPVRELLAAGLIRLDRTLLYPVRDGIPNVLVDEAIFL